MKKRPLRFRISFSAQALVYPFVLAGAFIFAQAQKMPISYMLFLVVLLLPAVSAIQLATIMLCLSGRLKLSDTKTEKGLPIRISAVITNKGPMPCSFVECEMLLPKEGEGDCALHKSAFSLMPFSSNRLESCARFPYCGEYEVGISKFYVYDFFRAVRIEISVEKHEKVAVMPRLFEFPTMNSPAWGDSAGNGGKRGDFEISGVREYTYGDNLKRIHWKLSSKSEEVAVKEYSGGDGVCTYILCDLYPVVAGENCSKTANRACLDLVIEGALSAAKRELDLSGSAAIAWVEYGRCASVNVRCEGDLERAVSRLYSLRNDCTEGQLSLLADSLPISADSSVVAVSPTLCDDRTDEYLAIIDRTLGGACRHEYLLCCDPALRETDENLCSVTDSGAARLLENGVNVLDVGAYAYKRRQRRTSVK